MVPQPNLPFPEAALLLLAHPDSHLYLSSLHNLLTFCSFLLGMLDTLATYVVHSGCPPQYTFHLFYPVLFLLFYSSISVILLRCLKMFCLLLYLTATQISFLPYCCIFLVFSYFSSPLATFTYPFQLLLSLLPFSKYLDLLVPLLHLVPSLKLMLYFVCPW